MHLKDLPGKKLDPEVRLESDNEGNVLLYFMFFFSYSGSILKCFIYWVHLYCSVKVICYNTCITILISRAGN